MPKYKQLFYININKLTSYFSVDQVLQIQHPAYAKTAHFKVSISYF